MGKTLKKAQAMSGLMLLASFGSLTTLASASADTGGGSGNGYCQGGICSAAPPYTWSYTSTNGATTAWQKFAGTNSREIGASGLYHDDTSARMYQIRAYRTTNQRLLELCQNSKMIWWLTNSRPWIAGKNAPKGWIWNGGMNSIPSTPSGSNLQNAISQRGSVVIDNLPSEATNWANATHTSNMVIVCSAQVNTNGANNSFTSNPVPTPTPTKSTPGQNPGGSPTSTAPSNPESPRPAKPAAITTQWPETQQVNRSGEEQQWQLPYSYITMITRQITGANGNDPIGKDNLHDQSNFSKTNFGKLWDDMNKNKDKYKKYSSAQVKDLVEKAIAADKKSDHAKLNLDAANKAGMAEGGVLNVNQLTKNATINSKLNITDTQSRNCTSTTDWVWDDNSMEWVKGTPNLSCTDWQTTASDSYLDVNTSVDTTPEQDAFWQMLSVHCNKDQFQALAKAAQGSKIVNTGDSTQGISAMIYSKKYTSQPGFLDFGDSNNPNKALAASGSLSFFDKECPFDCTSSPNGAGASSANGAISNIVKNKPSGSGATVGRYGAVAGVNNDSKLSFFRDNVKHLITTDVWYPVSSSVVTYNGDAPLNTTINRWINGTPSLDGSDGGKFTATTPDGKTLFTGDDTPGTQKNFVRNDEFSSATSQQLNGLMRAFNVQGTWASKDQKPQIFNFKWEYAPTVSTKAMVTGVGFDGDDNVIGTESILQTPIQGKCYSVYGTTNSYDTSKLFEDNTGTGVANNMDGSIDDENKDDVTSLYVTFVRSTTE